MLTEEPKNHDWYTVGSHRNFEDFTIKSITKYKKLFYNKIPETNNNKIY